MQEYTSPNSDLILKKTNSIVGQKITDFPQYKSALPKDFKYPRNDLPNIQAKEWFEIALHRELILWAENQNSWNVDKRAYLDDIHQKNIVPSIAARKLIENLFNK